MITQVKSQTDVLEKRVAQNHQDCDLVKLISLLDQKGWEYQVLGYGKMITSPFRQDNWKFLPRSMDDSTIPQEGLDRLEAIADLEINIQGIVIGHELDPKKKVKKRISQKWITWDEEKAGNVLRFVIYASLAVAAISLLPFILPLLCLGAAVVFGGVDPSIIVVLDDADNTWVEVYYWFDES